MTDIRIEIYPGATPTSGLLVTLNKDDYEEGTGLRQELNGDGSIQIVIHGDHPDCTAANFARGNYAKFIDLDLGAGEAIGGGFLSEGEFVAVSRKEAGGRVLTFGGPGSLAYLGRAAMDSAPYVASGDGVYNGPRDDMLWHWGVDNTIGSVIKRIIDEAQDADRPRDPIPALTYDFNNDDDSAGADWDFFTGSFTLRVGENYLSAIETFMRLGITIMMEPTLELHAYQNEFGTDRSSATFAAGKVRWVHGTNIAVATSGDVKHAIHESPRLKQVLVAGEGTIPATVVRVTDAGAPLEKEGYLQYTALAAGASASLTDAGEKDLALRAAESHTAIFSHKPGNTPLSGEYTPGWPGGAGHYWLGDTVRYHTGTGPFDFNEQNLRVAAIGWKLRTAGDWEIQVELGANYYSISTPSIAAGGVGVTACNCCPTGPSGPYEYSEGTPETVDALWTFDSDNLDDGSSTYPWGTIPTNWHAGYVHAHVTSPGIGMGTPYVPVTALATYHVGAHIARNPGSPYNPGGITLDVTTHPDGLVIETYGPVDVGTLGGGSPIFVGGDVVITAGQTHLSMGVPHNSSIVFDAFISHGGGGSTDTFDGDPLPLPSEGQGDHGTPGCMFAYFDHVHAAQTAANTPIGDAGGFFDGTDVEAALQELADAAFAGELDGLLDVTVPTPVEGDILRYDGAEWVNYAGAWEAVTDGEDVFVWEGDDLVHEWSV